MDDDGNGFGSAAVVRVVFVDETFLPCRVLLTEEAPQISLTVADGVHKRNLLLVTGLYNRRRDSVKGTGRLAKE
jgi:hypothetical protein